LYIERNGKKYRRVEGDNCMKGMDERMTKGKG
jgi:hypothetical protein